MSPRWTLACSECSATRHADGLPTVCECGAPWLVRYHAAPRPGLRDLLADRPWTMWRYREWLPLADDEEPVTLGEGGTPLLPAARLAQALGLQRVWIKDESLNPTGSFKARGMAAAVTRATRGGAERFTAPTAGNAGVALSAYGRRAGVPVRIFAPRTTPPRILEQIRLYGAELELVDGHIGDCGQAARAFGARAHAFDVSTLREPYRIEGKKTMGLELAEQLGWSLPEAVIYPTGGGTGLIGMWKAFNELRDAGWIRGALPRMYSVQAAGCAPIVRAFEAGAGTSDPWEHPETVAAGLRVPAPLGDRLILRALAASGGTAVAVSEKSLTEGAARLAGEEGVDGSPEGGAALAALDLLKAHGAIQARDTVVLFNTGAGWLYRST